MKLGFIQIETNKSVKKEGWHPCDLSAIHANKTEQHKLSLISKLSNANIIQLPTQCLFTDSHCTLLIHLLLHQSLNTFLNSFLDLLLHLSRESNMFVSLFDPIQHDTTLFNMFMDIPSPTLDYSCLSKDVLDFLHHVEPDIPGMKTTLYLYQKVQTHKHQ